MKHTGRKFISLLAVLAVLALLAAPLTMAAAFESYPDKDHQAVDFAEMNHDGFDDAALCEALEALESLHASGALEDKDTIGRAEALYQEIQSEINELETQAALITIWYDAAGGCGEAAQASIAISEQENLLFDRTYQTLALLAGTPCEAVLDAGEDYIEALENYEPLTDSLLALFQEEQQLIQSYEQLLGSMDAGAPDAQAQEAGELYRELVRLRTDIAREQGYDSYGDYAYWNIYSRDYSLEDIQMVRQAVKETFVPLQDKVAALIGSRELRALEFQGRAGGEEILDALEPFLSWVHPALMEAYEWMRLYHLYDIEYSEEKMPTGYTIDLPAYGTAFLFNSPYGTYQDYSDTVHEFGHFNNAFHSTAHNLWADFNIDVGEIHSQALELLFAGWADHVFGDLGETYRQMILYNIISSVVEGCLQDEFQAEVYACPDMEPEEMDRLFKELSEEYGYDYPPDQEGDNTWVSVYHTFQSPMYYISYATSALSSLDLWLRSQTDREEAAGTYMDLTVLSMSTPYREAVHQVELTDIFRRGGVEDIASRLESYLDGRPIPEPREEPSWLVKGLTGGTVAAAVILVPVLLLRSRRRERVEPFPDRRESPPWEL